LSDDELKLICKLTSIRLSQNLGFGSRESNQELADKEILEDKIAVFMGGIQKNGCVTKKKMTLIFSNLQLLYGVNCQLLELLKKNETPKGIAESFISLADYLKMYANYCSNQQTSIQTVVRLTEKKDKKFFLVCWIIFLSVPELKD